MKKATVKLHLSAACALLLMVIANQSIGQTFNPFSYYTFDNVASPLKDEMGKGNLDANYFSSIYTIGAAQPNSGVGKYLMLDHNTSIIRGSQFIPDTGLTIEFLLRPGYNFDGEDIVWSQNGSFTVRMGYPYITFYTNTYTNANVKVFDEFKINLTDIGRKSYGYYIDGNWHHMVFKMNPKTGVKQVWVDGECPNGFSKTISTLNTTFNPGQFNSIYITTNTSYLAYHGHLDEMAFYTYDLHPNMIYKHFKNFDNHQPYNFTWTTTAPPAPQPVTAGIDINEYAPGHPNPTVDMMDQIKTFPAARVKKGNTLLRNGTLTNHAYTGGRFRPGINDATAVRNSVEIQKQLSYYFNSAIQVSGATTEWAQFGDTTKFTGAWINFANQNPTIPTTISTSWPHVIPTMAGFTSNENYVTCRCLPNSSYLQNSAGQFIDNNGVVTPWKRLAPDSPLDSLIQDGLTQKFYFTKLFKELKRPLDFILDEAENLPFYRSVHTGPTLDASVVSNKNASGLDWVTYFSRRYAVQAKAYRDNFMNLPQLANTKYQLYETEGHDDYRPKYTESRTINSQTNGTYYPVASMYTRFPSNWRYNSAAWNGWQWFAESRVNEIAAGDNYCAPAVAAGWDDNEENNVRPAQWLGLNKTFAMAGAEYFFPAFFVLGGQTLQNPDNYIWQLTTPGYVQGVTSFYEDIFKNGKVLAGDVPLISTNPNGTKGYSFKAGDQRKLVVIRKHNTKARYAITGTLQPSSNMKGSAELEGNAVVTLDGQTLTFKVRRQGSTYVYDKTVASAPVFYQLDEWHEATHPYYWTSDFNIEGELFENTTTAITIKTSVPQGTPAGNFTSFTSYASFNSGALANYNFVVRGEDPKTYYFWVRARAKIGTTSAQIKMDNGPVMTINNMATGWKWYRISSSTNKPIEFKNLSVGEHLLRITAVNSNLEVDKICLSTQAGIIFGEPVSISDSIAIEGDINLCPGENVILTCDPAGISYKWSTGETTQSITVATNGSYYATITGAGNVKVKTDTVIVDLNPAPKAEVTVSGPTNICYPATITLTANNAYQYLWSNGKTTQSITVTKPEIITLTTANKKGCTAVAAPVQITDSGCCPLPYNLSAINITTTSAKIKWMCDSTPDDFNYTYTGPGGNSWNGIHAGGSKNITLTNLKANKRYKFSIQSICGSHSSNQSDTLEFTTLAKREGNLEDSESDILLYPNPSKQQTTLIFNSNTASTYHLTIKNYQGQIVQQQNGLVQIGENNFVIERKKLANGLYFIEFDCNNMLHHSKWMLQ
ncbi:MAG: fibronectin type III domain-containing protein [Bacteroidia bacterium]|nr:fibronectin type III domain-containing protein [Bacteroidia bacterium]